MEALLDFAGDAGWKLLLAVLLGGVVGFERESVGKPAGLRTNIMIAVGSTLLTIASVRISGSVGDPGRIAAQIVSGVGFIGAGTILQARGAVVGLTTAATIWAVAGIGIAIGADQIGLAFGATVIMITCLTLLGRLELSRVGRKDLTTFRIVVSDEQDPARVLGIFLTDGVILEHSALRKSGHGIEITVAGNVGRKDRDRLLAELAAFSGVRSVDVDV